MYHKVPQVTWPLAMQELMKIDKLEDLLTISESVIKGERIRRHLSEMEAIGTYSYSWSFHNSHGYELLIAFYVSKLP